MFTAYRPVELDGQGDQAVPVRPQEVLRAHRRARLRHVHRLHRVRHDDQGPAGGGQEPDPSGVRRRHPQARGPYDGAGLLCQPIDLSYETFGKIANDSCTWFVSVKDGKFKVLNGGKPETGKLVGDARAHRAVREQHRWGHHHGTASDRSTLTQPRSSCRGEPVRRLPSSRHGTARPARRANRDTLTAPRPATAEMLGRSGRLGGRTMNHRSRRALRAIAGTTIAAVTVVGLAATGVGAQTSTDPGVSAKAVKLGYIFSETGSAGSTFKNAGKACKARIDRANAAGGVNGRKIEVEYIDDQSSGANLTGGAGPRAEPQGVRGREQLLVRVPGLPVPARAGVPDGRGWLRRHLLRAEGQRDHVVGAGQRGAVQRPRVRQHHQGHEAARRQEERRDRLRRLAVVDRVGRDHPAIRRAGAGAQAGLHQHLGRLRQHRRRSHRPRHQELGRRRGVSPVGGVERLRHPPGARSRTA